VDPNSSEFFLYISFIIELIQLEEMKATNPTIPRQRLTSGFDGQSPEYFASEIEQGFRQQ